MGASNVKAVYAAWPHLDHLPFRILGYMALVAHDGNTPRFWGGREALALAAGRPVPDAQPGNVEVERERDNTFKSVERAMTTLSVAGAIRQIKVARPGTNAEYSLNLTRQPTLLDGLPIAGATGRCTSLRKSGKACLGWPKEGSDRCVAHQERPPLSGTYAPRSVGPMTPTERDQDPRSVDLMTPTQRGSEEEKEQQEQGRTTSQDEYLDLDTEPEVARATAKPSKCTHGFRIRARQDGTPDCALCRRETPCPADANPATPPTAPNQTAGPIGAPSADPNASPQIPNLSDWPTPSSPSSPSTSGVTGQPQPHHPAPNPDEAPSPPAKPASPPSSSATPTPAASGSWPIVHVRQHNGRPPEPAELREDNPQRPNVVKIVYLASRTSAWVARTRIVETLEHAA